MTEEEIHQICKKYNIENYKINDDMTVDVDYNVELAYRRIRQIPLDFNRVSGDFMIGGNEIRTLAGCPNYVGGIFSCSANQSLSTLKHLPMNFYIGGHFYSQMINIKDVSEYGRLFFGYIGGTIYTKTDSLNRFLNEHKNPPKKDLPKLLSELRKFKL